MGSGLALAISQASHFLQPPPHQSIIIERMHSGSSLGTHLTQLQVSLFSALTLRVCVCFVHPGARRFVTLDFGRPVLLTDVLIPTCADLASLSIDIWTLGEEVDGRRLVVATDISTHSLILHDLLPPPTCRFMKVRTLLPPPEPRVFMLSDSFWKSPPLSDHCHRPLREHQCPGEDPTGLLLRPHLHPPVGE